MAFKVASGEQLSDFGRAILLYQGKKTSEAAATFTKIAQQPQHLKFAATLFWIVKLIDEEPSLVRATRWYGDDAIAQFDNASQRETYWTAAVLLARERYEREEWARSIPLFQRVDAQSPYYATARDCIQAARAKAH